MPKALKSRLPNSRSSPPAPPTPPNRPNSVQSATTFNVSNGSSKKRDDTSTHIEVCARIRPLEILVKREGFFDSKMATSSQSRIPQRKPTGRGQKDASSPTSSGSDNIVAWNVSADGETASQSLSTNVIQGRTHSYTLDKVYAPDSNTKQLYDMSVKPLVKSAMEGYHSSVLAYGQTSTGKTFTMTVSMSVRLCVCVCSGRVFVFRRNSESSYHYFVIHHTTPSYF